MKKLNEEIVSLKNIVNELSFRLNRITNRLIDLEERIYDLDMRERPLNEINEFINIAIWQMINELKQDKEREMDKQISKVKRDLDKGEKDVKKLQKMDKKFDKKLEKAGVVKKKK